jgi:hypothetical protein
MCFCFVLEEVAAAHHDADMALSADDAIELPHAVWLRVQFLVVLQGVSNPQHCVALPNV